MFRNYLKTAWRNLVRNKAFSFINIFGLSLGMTCSLLIFLWVQDERRVDQFNVNTANIYDVYERVFSEGKVDAAPVTPGLLATELRRKIPEIQYASSFWNRNAETLFSVGDKNMSFTGCAADTDFFTIFDYPLLQGRRASALAGPDAIAISGTMANDFFGSPAAAYGKTIRYNDAQDFKITAVFDVPANSSRKFDFVANWDFQLKSVGWLYDWINRSPETFVQLRPGADPAKVEAKIKNFVMSYLGHYGSGFHIELGLQRFDKMYLNATFKNGVPDGGRIEYVRLFSIVAVFILLMACINFMNLATARSVKRAKEVGVRKTIGALRWRLVIQFMGEAMLFSILAGLVALLLVTVALPSFNELTNKQIALPVDSPCFWLSVIGLLCLTGLVAGSYPALFLSSLNPVRVLKGALRFSPKAILFRKGLVVFQFVLSIVLIISTIVVSQQVHYVQTKNLGFDKENLVFVPYQGDMYRKLPLFKQELSNMPGVAAVTMSTQAPSYIGAHVYDLDWDGKNPNTKVIGIHNGIGYDYPGIMGLKLSKGRFFSRDFPSDTSHSNPPLVINETLAKIIGFKDPVGKRLLYFGSMGTIIGVVKDFNLRSLHDPIEPLVLYWGEDSDWGGVLVKTAPGRTGEAIASIGKIFKQMEPRFPLRYSFADEEYQKLYSSEQTIGSLSNSFSFLAILISCLGLLGLTMFTVEQRRKEIGVRKVVGAGMVDIVLMISGDIVKLVLLSAVIAAPVAWLLMGKWLQDYAYHIRISWWIFIAAGGAALFVALATVGYLTFKAARANPVKSLRTE